MKYEFMFPDQIREAIDQNWPVVFPFGVLEFHDEHCCVGVDTLVITGALEILEKEIDMVVLPAYYYGASSYAVAIPDRSGTIHIDSDIIHKLAKDLFKSLLSIGFKNIHVLIHHQSENFAAGMPNDLALRLAARQVLFELIESEKGLGWWGDDSMQDYYIQHDAGDDPFNWIKVHPFMDEEIQKKFPIDHAGKQETSLMMAFCPEGVDMKRFAGTKWFAKQAVEADKKYADEAKQAVLEGLRKALKS